jgi:hypothetical protein
VHVGVQRASLHVLDPLTVLAAEGGDHFSDALVLAGDPDHRALRVVLGNAVAVLVVVATKPVSSPAGKAWRS